MSASRTTCKSLWLQKASWLLMALRLTVERHVEKAGCADAILYGVVQREEALKKSEQMLEEDALRFDAFLKENDEKVQEAIKKAEVEAKAKQDKVVTSNTEFRITGMLASCTVTLHGFPHK